MATMTMQPTPGQIILRHQTKAPVNVVAIANDLGLRVWEMHDLGGTSGKIFVDPLNGGAAGYSIGVNASENYRRKRFTVAHEIAHFVLHRDKIGDELLDDAMYRGKLSNADEVAANKLAADILMPKSLIQRFKAQGMNAKTMSDELEVSEPAMQIRLSYL